MQYVFLDPDGTLRLGLLVIVEAKTGVIYRTQCAGLLTRDRSLEGFLIPVGDAAAAARIYNWVMAECHGTCYGNMAVFNSEQLESLKVLISEIACWFTSEDGDQDQRLFLLLDVDRISECVEAWIPVLTPYGRGILTLDNSD